MGVSLVEEVWEHKNKFIDGFTRQHNIYRLVWFEQHEPIESAIIREKQIKIGIGLGKSGKSKPLIPIGTICT